MVTERSRPRWFKWIKWTIVVVVAAGLVLMLREVIRDLRSSQLDLGQVRWGWVGAACVLYGLGTIPGAIYWHQVLIALGQHPTWSRSLRAFFFSQLGKYVPGKAMVVVMRSTMVGGPEVRASIAVTSVFVETLTWMAVGSAIGSLLLAFLNPQQSWLIPLGLGFAMGALISLSPPVFGQLLKRIRRWKNASAAADDLHGLGYWTILRGLLLMSMGWTLVGASMWAVLVAVPGPAANWTHFGLAMECVTLSVVIGIASLIPGGLGVRELVIVPLLTRDFGAPKALACAILIRLVWMISEVLIVGIIQCGARLRSPRARETSRDSMP